MYFNDNITDKMGFNLVATAYEQARPSYPDYVFQYALQAMGLTTDLDCAHISKVLEIGSGSGQATSDLIRMADKLDCIEPGDNFAALMRSKFAPFLKVSVIKTFFEEYSSDNHYDLIVSASALHWIPQDIAYTKIKELLRPGGWLLAIWNQSRFSSQIDALIDEIFSDMIPGFRIPRCDQDERDLFDQGFNDFAENRGFINCQHTIYSEPRIINAETLINLIWSYVSPVHLTQEERKQLHFSLCKAVDETGLEKHELTNFFPIAIGQLQET